MYCRPYVFNFIAVSCRCAFYIFDFFHLETHRSFQVLGAIKCIFIISINLKNWVVAQQPHDQGCEKNNSREDGHMIFSTDYTESVCISLSEKSKCPSKWQHFPPNSNISREGVFQIPHFPSVPMHELVCQASL